MTTVLKGTIQGRSSCVCAWAFLSTPMLYVSLADCSQSIFVLQ